MLCWGLIWASISKLSNNVIIFDFECIAYPAKSKDFIRKLVHADVILCSRHVFWVQSSFLASYPATLSYFYLWIFCLPFSFINVLCLCRLLHIEHGSLSALTDIWLCWVDIKKRKEAHIASSPHNQTTHFNAAKKNTLTATNPNILQIRMSDARFRCSHLYLSRICNDACIWWYLQPRSLQMSQSLNVSMWGEHRLSADCGYCVCVLHLVTSSSNLWSENKLMNELVFCFDQ